MYQAAAPRLGAGGGGRGRRASAVVIGLYLLGWHAMVFAAGPLSVHTQSDSRQFDAEDLVALLAPDGRIELRVHEPHEGRERSYAGVWVNRLLDSVYGEAWHQAGAVVFECADGYRALVAPERLLGARALLAWAAADDHAFTLVNRLQGDEPVDLAPYYLVWDNREDPELRAAGAGDWPYQIVGIALADADSLLARARPPADAGAAVERGFAAFRSHCVACHSVNGDGGDKGPELNRPVSVTEYLASGWLQRWMLEPASIRPTTTMPGLPAQLAERDAVAADIEAYLRAMAATR